MPAPICGNLSEDHADEHIPWMNHAIWAEDVGLMQARAFKARYYGEITFIDACIGRILDAVEARPHAANTLICFFSDHGEHLGDHHAWQKESFFDASCRIPMLVSWPAKLPADTRSQELVSLTDLFATASAAAGEMDARDGWDLVSLARGEMGGRQHLVGIYGIPGTRGFKVMIRREQWKYIFMANGGRRQLFDLQRDPHELLNCAGSELERVAQLHALAVDAADCPGTRRALSEKDLRGFDFEPLPRKRICQFDASRGIRGFPKDPRDVLATAGTVSTGDGGRA